jgi:putative PIN family toxin of toxin-antitoxin system
MSDASSPPRPVVLDTNVVLDMLFFDDPVVRPLAAAVTAGTLIAWADVHTLTELERVLAYTSFALDVAAQQALHARYRSLVRVVPEDPDAPLPTLPRCRDRDDQKFLRLAARVGDCWLVSKDKQLLSLADRSGLPFSILTPKQAVQQLLNAPASSVLAQPRQS